ncbi:hypothetical protein [Verrucomicrobium sp. GAS474]|uniref:hypothetical protein n=1 Tax=Verrucomicrobium sp. GAS474 TaxID=1882831 RepID=UPI0012FFA5B0|nr:hypothetical protein [Verrucomicrobium sp. GAS474]
MNKNSTEPPKETGNWSKKDTFDKVFDFLLGAFAGGFVGAVLFLRRSASLKAALVAIGCAALVGGIFAALFRPKHSNLHEQDDFWQNYVAWWFWPWRRK